LPDILQLLEPTSSGNLWWIGAGAELFIGKAQLSAIGIYELGQIVYHLRRGDIDRDLASYLADISLEGNLNNWVSLGLFFFTAGGDDDIRDDTVTSFVSPLPYNSRAAIFFDPEWVDRNTEGTLAYGGTTAYGVVAPGVTVTLLPMADLLITGTLATFYPQVTAPNDRVWYGWEADIDLNYPIWRDIQFYFEAARFEFGNFFKDNQGKVPDPSWLLSVGCRMVY